MEIRPPGSICWLLMGVTAVLDSSVAGKSLVPRLLLQAFRWPAGLPSNMVGVGCLRVPLLCRLLDSINQRLPPREKLLHLRYDPFGGAVVVHLLTVIQGRAIRRSIKRYQLWRLCIVQQWMF